jgi:hypothetical protein
LAEMDAQTPMSHTAGRSRKLTTIVIVLAILPLLLPLPTSLFAFGVTQVIVQCPVNCPYTTFGERLEWLLMLGPSFLAAVASILLGIIGNVRIRRQPFVSKDEWLFDISIACGIVWLILLGGFYGVIFWISGIAP